MSTTGKRKFKCYLCGKHAEYMLFPEIIIGKVMTINGWLKGQYYPIWAKRRVCLDCFTSWPAPDDERNYMDKVPVMEEKIHEQ